MGLLRLSWRSIWRNRRRTAITVSAISFALALAVFFLAFAGGVYQQMIDDAVRMQAGHITLEHPEYRDAPAVDLTVRPAGVLRDRLGRLEGVERTKLVVLGQGVARVGTGAVGVAVWGVEPAAEREGSLIARKLVEGEYLRDDDRGKAVIGAKLARRLKLKVGKKLVLSCNNAKGDLIEELVRVRGVFSTGADEIDGYLIQVPMAFAQKLFGLRPDEVTQLGLVLQDSSERDEVLVRAQAEVGDATVAVLPWEAVLPELAAYIKLDGGSNFVMQGILIFLSLFTIFNTILMSVVERTREFAVLLALGTPAWRLRAQIVIESALVGLVGVGVGLLIGGLAGYAMQVYGLDLSALYEEGISVSGLAIDARVYARVTPGLLGGLGGLVLGATVLTSLLAVQRIGKISVADVLR